MAEVIPLQDVPAQSLGVTLDGQPTTIVLRQLSTGLYLQLLVNDQEIVGLVVCQNLNRIVRNSYLGFRGDLVFVDNFGEEGKPSEDPHFPGLGTHFSLIYLSEADLAGGL